MLRAAALVLLGTSVSMSQGVWDIAYIPVDSMPRMKAGTTVRIDFKSPVHTKRVNSIRSLLQYRDTISIQLDGQRMVFQEHWKLYADHGVLTDQFLTNVNHPNKIIIRQVTLRSCTPGEARFDLSVYQGDSHTPIVYTVAIDKSRIAGILISTSDNP